MFKFIKEAVTAYPELYFAKTVVLGEGESEEIIIRKMLELKNLSIDSSEISIVPLGGRHVNHFWKLLFDLEIPFVTLLDLDRERSGGGWGRIKYAIQQLIENGADKNKLLETTEGILPDEELDLMHNWNVDDTNTMQDWINMLKEYDIYFSSPLDIDYAMLANFKEEYINTLNGNEGPRLENFGKISELIINEENASAYQNRVISDVEMTLKKEGGDGSTYSSEEKQLMVWYTYFFLSRGKPTTHLSFFSEIDDLSFDDFPECLKEFVNRIVEKNINVKIEDGPDDECN